MIYIINKNNRAVAAAKSIDELVVLMDDILEPANFNFKNSFDVLKNELKKDANQIVAMNSILLKFNWVAVEVKDEDEKKKDS